MIFNYSSKKKDFNKLYYGCWNKNAMGNSIEILFFGSPYCFSNEEINPSEDYFDGSIKDENKNIINKKCVSPANTDCIPSFGNAQNDIVSVEQVKPLYFYNPKNESTLGNHSKFLQT